MLPVLSSHAECSLHWAVQEVRLETKVSLFQHVQFGGAKQKPNRLYAPFYAQSHVHTARETAVLNDLGL